MVEEIELKTLKGIGDATSEKLEKAGYHSVNQLAVVAPVELIGTTGLGKETAEKIIHQARKKLDLDQFKTAKEILDEDKREFITTGSKAIDKLIGGKGIETMSITEAYGRYSSGKSQLGFQLCLNVQLPKEQGGLEGKAVFIDAESTWRTSRLVQMAQARGLDEHAIMENIKVAQCYNTDHLLSLLNIVSKDAKAENYRLLVVDSLVAPFRTDYVGRETLASRQQKLNTIIHLMQRIADINEMAVYITNQVMDKPDALYTDPTQPIGGNVVAHQAVTRLYMRRAKANNRVVKLVDSPNQPEGEAVFCITDKGIDDVEEAEEE